MGVTSKRDPGGCRTQLSKMGQTTNFDRRGVATGSADAAKQRRILHVSEGQNSSKNWRLTAQAVVLIPAPTGRIMLIQKIV